MYVFQVPCQLNYIVLKHILYVTSCDTKKFSIVNWTYFQMLLFLFNKSGNYSTQSYKIISIRNISMLKCINSLSIYHLKIYNVLGFKIVGMKS
jgi:hypothetical protein